MSNSFFDWSTSPNRLVRFDTARAEDINAALDSASSGFDGVEIKTRAALKLPDGESATVLPAPAARAGKVLAFDASGNPVADLPATAVYNAEQAALDALTSWNAFDQRNLGAHNTDPTTDNSGQPLIEGAVYWNTSIKEMRVWDGAAWSATYIADAGYLRKAGGTMTGDLTLAGSPTNSLHAATKAYADAASTVKSETRSSNTMLTAADKGKFIDLQGSFSQTFADASVLGNGWYAYLRANGPDEVFGPELISGEPTDLGPNLIVNGGFDTDTDWVKGTGITISGGTAVFTASGAGQALTATVAPLTAGKLYKATFDIYLGSGSVSLAHGAISMLPETTLGLPDGKRTTVTRYFVAAGTAFGFKVVAAATGVIDNVSVQEVLRGPYLSPEIVLNGDFAQDAYWTKGTGWTISGGTANAGGATANLTANAVCKVVDNLLYKVVFTISSYVGGTLTPSVGGTTGTAVSGNGTYTQYISPASAGGIALVPSTFTGVVDNVSVKAVTIGPTTLEQFPDLGPDQVVNGGFDADTDWTKGAGWTISGGVAVATASTANLTQTLSGLIKGALYKVTYTIASFTSGSVQVLLGANAGTAGARAAAGTFTEYLIAPTNGAFLIFDGVTAFTGTIDSVSVQLVQRNITPLVPGEDYEIQVVNHTPNSNWRYGTEITVGTERIGATVTNNTRVHRFTASAAHSFLFPRVNFPAMSYVAEATAWTTQNISLRRVNGTITLAPSQSIDGRSQVLMYPKETRLVFSTGTAFKSVVMTGFYKEFYASGNFIKPPGYSRFSGLLHGPGCAGSQFNGSSGGTGGRGGAAWPFNLPDKLLQATEPVLIGAGGNNDALSVGIIAGGTSAFAGAYIKSSTGVESVMTNNAIGDRAAVATASVGWEPSNTAPVYAAGSGASNLTYPAMYCGGGGHDYSTFSGVTISLFAGNGGRTAVGSSAAYTNGEAGYVPSGGGAGGTNAAGNGARGELRIWGEI